MYREKSQRLSVEFIKNLIIKIFKYVQSKQYFVRCCRIDHLYKFFMLKKFILKECNNSVKKLLLRNIKQIFFSKRKIRTYVYSFKELFTEKLQKTGW